MKLSDAYKIVKGCMVQHVPVMLWGPPGIGKSSLIHQLLKSWDLMLLIYVLLN